MRNLALMWVLAGCLLGCESKTELVQKDSATTKNKIFSKNIDFCV